MPLFLAMFTDMDQFSIVLLAVVTKGPQTKGSEINSGPFQTTHNISTILLKMNLITNLHQREYKSFGSVYFYGQNRT